MSLLSRISNIFSKKQSLQLIGVSLQQESLSVCFSPTRTAASKNVFLQKKVSLQNFFQAINELKIETNFSGQCHIVLNALQSQIVQVDKPNVPNNEITSALKWQIKDLVSISPDNMVLDYFDGPLLAGGKKKVNVVCSPLNELKKIVEIINQDGITVASITTAEFAFANLLPVQKKACLFVCQQPNEDVILIIVKDGQLYFHRRLRGFSQMASKSEDELAMTMVEALALEIQRSSDYFERQLKQAPIKEIKILLPMASENFFARKLAENTQQPVTLLSLPAGFEKQRDYAAAIGAMGIVNQYNEEQVVQEPAEEVSHVSG